MEKRTIHRIVERTNKKTEWDLWHASQVLDMGVNGIQQRALHHCIAESEKKVIKSGVYTTSAQYASFSEIELARHLTSVELKL